MGALASRLPPKGRDLNAFRSLAPDLRGDLSQLPRHVCFTGYGQESSKIPAALRSELTANVGPLEAVSSSSYLFIVPFTSTRSFSSVLYTILLSIL